MKRVTFFCLISSIHVIFVVESRFILDSEPGVISNGIVNAVRQKQKTELEQNARQPRQDDEDDGSSSGSGSSGGSSAASAAGSSSAAFIQPNTPIGQIIQNIVPDAQGAVVSIIKAVQSPFDFISKSVDNYINPTTPPTTEAPKRNSGQNQYGMVLSSGNSDITVVLLPEAINPISVPVTSAKVVEPVVVDSNSPTTSEADEEDEEGSNSDY